MARALRTMEIARAGLWSDGGTIIVADSSDPPQGGGQRDGDGPAGTGTIDREPAMRQSLPDFTNT